MTTEQIKQALDLHSKWLCGEEGARRADFSGVDLIGANLIGANLNGADLSRAYLNGANFDQAIGYKP